MSPLFLLAAQTHQAQDSKNGEKLKPVLQATYYHGYLSSAAGFNMAHDFSYCISIYTKLRADLHYFLSMRSKVMLVKAKRNFSPLT
jgi:hypothetical protein